MKKDSEKNFWLRVLNTPEPEEDDVEVGSCLGSDKSVKNYCNICPFQSRAKYGGCELNVTYHIERWNFKDMISMAEIWREDDDD